MCIDPILLPYDNNIPKPAYPLLRMAFYPDRSFSTNELKNGLKWTGFTEQTFQDLKPHMCFKQMQNISLYLGRAAPALWFMQQNAHNLVETKTTMTVFAPYASDPTKMGDAYGRARTLYPNGKEAETHIICFAAEKEKVTHLVSQLGHHDKEPSLGIQRTEAYTSTFIDDIRVESGGKNGQPLTRQQKEVQFATFGWLATEHHFMFFTDERLLNACRTILFDKKIVIQKPMF